MEQELREEELNEVRHLLEANQIEVNKWKNYAREKAKCERSIRCDGTPNPSEQRELNTYISLCRDNPEVTAVLKDCATAQQLIYELEELLEEVGSPAEAQRYQEALLSLQMLIHSKHLLYTNKILMRATVNLDESSGNMHTVVSDNNITLCVWANISKNPSFKGLQFEEVGVGVALPRQLCKSDIAVRILHTSYDHLTHLAYPRAHEELQSIRGLVERKQSVQSMASVRSSFSKRSVEEPQSDIHTQIQELSLEGNDDLALVKEVIDSCETATVVDLFQYTPLGGVYYCDLFRLPPQVKKVRGWEMVQLLDKGLESFPYPIDQSQNLGSVSDSGELSCQPTPIGLSIPLPDSVIFLVPPLVACWDAAEKQWTTDGICDTLYEETEARISFKMDSFRAFTLMQDTYVTLPLQGWELRPLGQESALFTINATLMDLSIIIQGHQCMLQSDQVKGLSHLVRKWMSVPVLKKAMVKAGVNIFVNEHTDNYVATCGKDPLTEQAAYEQMALLSSAYAFSWSQWNAQCGGEYLIMRVCEHHDPSPVPNNLWSVYLLGAQRSQKLHINEHSKAFLPELYPDSEVHFTFLHMLRDHMSPEGVAKIKECHYLFVDTVQSLLSATRPLNYTSCKPA